MFLYAGYKHDINSDDHWKGLFRSILLIKVRLNFAYLFTCNEKSPMQAFKHIFTSPSSVEKEPKATRSGNARIHGMTSVTIGSIAYVATQASRMLASFNITSLLLIPLASCITDTICAEFFSRFLSI